MKDPTRRSVLAGAAGLAGAQWMGLGCTQAKAPVLKGEILGGVRAERGHLLRSSFVPPTEGPGQDTRADVVIVGGGVAGLSAAWRLRRAGFAGEILLLELHDALGGTSASATGATGAHPWGAHYITLPNREARHMRAMLSDLGVIEGFDAEGRPYFDPAAVCLAPQERLHMYGEWIHGIWPATGMALEDQRQHKDFLAQCAAWEQRVGGDGLPAFNIPVHHSSRDPEIRSLVQLSFSDWFFQQGYTSERLYWWLEYGCRDDYGTSMAQTSAWAGLHYHCARRPEAADARDMGTHVLTWPAGNGWLVDALAQRAKATIWTGAVARQIEPDTGRVWVNVGSEVRRVEAQVIICAVQSRIADRLVGRTPAAARPGYAPWCVAQLHCDELPSGRGVPAAWDSVIYGAESLGVVSSAHQLGQFRGPTVLTWYHPLSGDDPRAALLELVQTPWEQTADTVLTELARAHPDIRSRVQRLDVWHWGHGTARPSVGLHQPGSFQEAMRPMGRVHFAHTDQSGMSLFEEAAWHGVRAGEAALDALGLAPAERLL